MKVIVIGVDGRAKSVEHRMRKEGHEVVLVHTLDDADLVLNTIETFGQPDLIVATRIETSAYGVVDRLRDDGYVVFGVSKEHSQIETSKAYGKTTASGMDLDGDLFVLPAVYSFKNNEVAKALETVRVADMAFTVKPDGISGGKGTVVCETVAETLYELEHGDWNSMDFLLEETVIGEEFSTEFWVSGGHAYPMILNLEFKSLAAGDLGAMTAGMAAVMSNSTLVSSPLLEKLQGKVEAFAVRTGYSGPLYITFIHDAKDNMLKFIEFNCRLCDPEFEIMEPMVIGSLYELMLSIAKNEPRDSAPCMKYGYGIGVVVIAGGYPYPNACLQGLPIMYEGKPLTSAVADTKNFMPMGVLANTDGWVTEGGRQFVACEYSDGTVDAAAQVYQNLSGVRFKDATYRTDIWERALQRLGSLADRGIIR